MQLTALSMQLVMVMPFLTVVKLLHSNAYLVHDLLAVLLMHCCGATEHLVSPISNAGCNLQFAFNTDPFAKSLTQDLTTH